MEFFKCYSADLRILAEWIDDNKIDPAGLHRFLTMLTDELEIEMISSGFMQ